MTATNRSLQHSWKRRISADAVEALQAHAAPTYGADGEPTDPGHLYNILLRYRTRLALRNGAEAARLANFLQSVATNGDVSDRRAYTFEEVAMEIAEAFDLQSEMDTDGSPDGEPVFLFQGKTYRTWKKGDTRIPDSFQGDGMH